MKLGDNILKLRKEKKLSQEQLAEKVNVTRQTISNWELGETQPTPEQLKTLSKIFSVSIDELLENDIGSRLIEKVSNTERLAGFIIKILKGIGIFLIVLLVIEVIAFVLFSFTKQEVTSSNVNEITMNCSLDNNDYLITVGSDGYYNCSNCSKEIQGNIKEIVDHSSINETVKNVENYFISRSGNCE